jgi:hypothetical protein
MSLPIGLLIILTLKAVFLNYIFNSIEKQKSK